MKHLLLKTLNALSPRLIALGCSSISLFLLLNPVAHSEGLLRSIWSCDVPCAVRGHSDQLLSAVHVTYCSTSALSPAMLETLTPVCQAKTKRMDAVAIRTSLAAIASCSSSANTCPKEGLTRAGYTCSVVCPSEDKLVRKYTACATTGQEAWSFATQICKDAVAPDPSIIPPSQICTAEGQTSCD